MRIAFFHELHFGGARRVVYEYAKVLSEKHKVDLFYVDKEEEGIEKFFKKSYFYKIEFEKYIGKNPSLKIYNDFVLPLKLRILHKKIAQEIDKKKYDFVFVHPSQFTHAPFVLRYLRTPTLYFCHEPLRTVYDPVVGINNTFAIKKIYENSSRRIRKKIDKENIIKANLVVTNCNYSKVNIEKAYGINPAVCYLGVDPETFKPLNLNKVYDLIFVGDTIPMEGYDTFMKIADLYNGKLKTKIVKPSKEKYITDDELAIEYNKSKVLAVLGRFDPFSMIPWEGMSCATPPVIVDEGGPIEAVKDGKTGFIIGRDPIKFKKVIDLLLNNDGLRKEIGERGRRDVLENWTWEKSAQRILEISKKL